MTLTAEVATYDPIRGKGFLKILDEFPVSRLLFHVRDLPESVRDLVVEKGAVLRKKPRVQLAPEEFQKIMNEVRSILKSRRFALDAKQTEGGQHRLVRGSMREIEHGPERAASPGRPQRRADFHDSRILKWVPPDEPENR